VTTPFPTTKGLSSGAQPPQYRTDSAGPELYYDRKLPKEEVHVSWSFSPIVGADGRTVDGVFCQSAEETEKVVDAVVLHPDGHRLPMYASDALKNRCRSGSGLSIESKRSPRRSR
jgi:hypothetical protein